MQPVHALHAPALPHELGGQPVEQFRVRRSLAHPSEIVGRGHENANMQNLILTIKADVEAGGTLTEALSKHPLY